MESTTPKNAIVLVFDGLSPGFLGPYGNTWVDTPAFNKLAAESLLVEHAISDSPVSASLQPDSYRGFWNGQHAMSTSSVPPRQLLTGFRARQINTFLVTDDSEFATACSEVGFDRVHCLPPFGAARRANEISETRFAQLLVRVIDSIQQAEEPFCIWVHASSLVSLWDAPDSILAQMRDEDDPDPPNSVLAPSLQLKPDDPDALWGWSVLYAAQVRAIDECLGVLLATVAGNRWWESTLFLLTSTHGFPLGEHGMVGPINAPLNTELVHVPLISRIPGQDAVSLRLQSVCQPSTVHATLLEWFGFIQESDLSLQSLRSTGENRARPVALSRSSAQSATVSIRTPAWHAIFHGPDAKNAQLYVKPDDRWDFNEVAQRCPEIVRLLAEELMQFRNATQRQIAERIAADGR